MLNHLEREDPQGTDNENYPLIPRPWGPLAIYGDYLNYALTGERPRLVESRLLRHTVRALRSRQRMKRARTTRSVKSQISADHAVQTLLGFPVSKWDAMNYELVKPSPSILECWIVRPDIEAIHSERLGKIK